MYEYAIELIKKGLAYVDDLNADQIREHRGTLTRPGKESPFRNRSVEENLDLFDRMRKGEFADGSKTLRAKIDMSSPNLNLRDPVISRVLDDPRMPTIGGFRRRGYTPESIRAFCAHIGVNKMNSTVEINVLENFLRDDLNKRAPRKLAVLRPIKVVIDNYPETQTEQLDVINNPEDPSAGTRKVPFGRELYIEREDFAEVPPPKYFRLFPGNEVRLRCAYYIKCTHVEKDSGGNVTTIHCTYDPATRGGDSPDKRKVKSTIHWGSAKH